jgi:ABC-type transport system involved in multi-copper enzyme maturation permease subunit
MVGNALTIANKDMKLLLKEKTFTVILLMFIVMSLASTYIGWSSHHTVMSVYDETAKELALAGKAVPPSPFSSVPPLDILKNMSIYVVLIGALLAIILGHIISTNDRKAGTMRILLSKPLSKNTFLLGKIIASSLILFIALTLSFIISVTSVWFIGSLSIAATVNIITFYFASFVYLAGFSYIGIFFGLKTDSSTKAILLPLLIWIAITFVLPEFGSALYPTSSLNPILPTTHVLDSPILSTIHSIIYPLSISEQYKEFTANALGLTLTKSTNIISYSQAAHLSILIMWLFLTLGLSVYAMKRFNPAQGDDYE